MSVLGFMYKQSENVFRYLNLEHRISSAAFSDGKV